MTNSSCYITIIIGLLILCCYLFILYIHSYNLCIRASNKKLNNLSENHSLKTKVKIHEVLDGDTFLVKIGLYGIDCPDNNQSFGEEAKEFVKKMIEGKEVEIEIKDKKKDPYDRLSVILTIDKININEELLSRGLTWCFQDYCDIPHYKNLQEKAKDERLKIWTEPIPPWIWKEKNHSNSSTKIKIRAKVNNIVDGDTFDAIIREKHTNAEISICIRLWGVDCPENNQLFGKEAKEFTKKMIEGKEIVIEQDEKCHKKYDRGRILAVITVDSINLNEELLRNGLAWASVLDINHKPTKEHNYYNLHEEAKKAQLNIWSDNNPINPSEWRLREKYH